jgi:hypothetical protein
MSAVTTPIRRRTCSGALRVSYPRTSTEPRADVAERRGLARSVRAEQPEDLTRLCLEGDTAQDVVLAERLLEALDRYRRLGHLSTNFSSWLRSWWRRLASL